MDDQRIENAVREFLGDSAPASELRQYREALEQRLRRLREEAAQDPTSHEALRLRIQHLEEQVKALAEEEAINSFVEDSVRSSVLDLGHVSEDAAPHDATLPPWASIDIDDEPEDLG